MKKLSASLLVICSISLAHAGSINPLKPVFPTAVFPFDARGDKVKSMGPVMSEMVFAELSADTQFVLVDLASTKVAVEKAALERSNDVDVKEAGQVGLRLGVQIVVVGSVVETAESVYVIAKIISTQNGHVLGASVKGGAGDNLAVLAEAIAQKISEVVDQDGSTLLASVDSPDLCVSFLNQTLGTMVRPNVMLTVKEQHIGDAMVEPVVEALMMQVLAGSGFVATNHFPDGMPSGVAVDVKAVSELSLQRRDVVAARVWLEYKAMDRATGKVVAGSTQYAAGVGRSESEAATMALQQATGLVLKQLSESLVASGN
jgi:TolB-like protein